MKNYIAYKNCSYSKRENSKITIMSNKNLIKNHFIFSNIIIFSMIGQISKITLLPINLKT
jgi:hypothetical protein